MTTIERLRELLSASTPGDWLIGIGKVSEQDGEVYGVGIDTLPHWTPVALISKASTVKDVDRANAEFIVAAHSTLNKLLDVVQAAKAMVADSDRTYHNPRADEVKAFDAALAKLEGGE